MIYYFRSKKSSFNKRFNLQKSKGYGSISEERSRVVSMRLKTKRKPYLWI